MDLLILEPLISNEQSVISSCSIGPGFPALFINGEK